MKACVMDERVYIGIYELSNAYLLGIYTISLTENNYR